MKNMMGDLAFESINAMVKIHKNGKNETPIKTKGVVSLITKIS